MGRRRRVRAIPVLVVVFVVMQLFPAKIAPRATDPTLALESSVQTTGEIGALLRRGCYDCHGGPTSLPWYGHVAPASWLVVYDVNESMGKLDFSRWGELASGRQAQRLRDMAGETAKGEMPLDRYLWLHPEARFTAAEKEEFRKWAEGEAEKIERAWIESNGAGGAEHRE
jgi:hypothetical protein